MHTVTWLTHRLNAHTLTLPHAQAINAFAPIYRTQQSKIELDKILNLHAFDLKRVLDVEPDFLAEDAEHQVKRLGERGRLVVVDGEGGGRGGRGGVGW